MAITIDARERKLLGVYNGDHDVATLAVGDISCSYTDISKNWIAERKTAPDLANCIKSGRWHDQNSRLFATGKRIVFLFEGDFRMIQGLPYDTLMSAMTNATLRKGCAVYRTFDVWETAFLIKSLAHKMEAWSVAQPITQGLAISKRKRDSDVNTCWLRMLTCVPSISEQVAKALLGHFHTLPALCEHLRTEDDFPRIEVGKVCIGKARVKKLRSYLLGAD